MWKIWLIVCLLFLITELLHHDRFFLAFIGSSSISLLISLIIYNPVLQIIIFLAVSFFLKIILYKFFPPKPFKKPVQPLTTDALIGTQGKVIKPIGINTLQSGLVKVDGEIWSAVSNAGEQIPKGSLVQIESIHGVRLTVIPISHN